MRLRTGLGGSWFEGNWRDPSTDIVGCGKSGRSLPVNIHGFADQKPVVHVSQARLRLDYYDFNISLVLRVCQDAERGKQLACQEGGWLEDRSQGEHHGSNQEERVSQLVMM